MNAARHMSDKQWLAAIDKHRVEWRDKRNNGFVGGPEELAGVMAQLAKEQPERFAQLGLRIGPGAPHAYLEGLLLALTEPGADTEPASDEALFALVRHIAAMPDPPAARWIGRLVATRADHDIPANVLEAVTATAAHLNPEKDLWIELSPNGRAWYGGDPWSYGMNTVRGAAAHALGRLVSARADRVQTLLPAIRALATDPVAAVRTCAAEALGGLMRWERSLGLTLALELADTDDRAVAARPVVDLLAAYIPTDWPTIEPIVVRLLGAAHGSARRGGATLVCLAALQLPEASDFLERCLTHHDETVRETTAGVLSANLPGARYTTMCAEGLRRLFDDDNSKVRQAAVRSFWQLRRHDLGEFEGLARALLGSKALAEGRAQLLHSLKDSTADVADVAVVLAEQTVATVRGVGDIRTAAAGEAKELSELLIRLLGDDAVDEALRARALDALDRLVAAGAWGAVDAMDSVER